MSHTKKIINKEKRLITAALPYINNLPHLGHIVGSHLPADIFARFCRMKGHETLFIGGTDENGSASEIAADNLGIDIDIFSKKLHEEHKKIYEWFAISYDNFSRTSSKIHHRTVKDFFKEIYKHGFIKEGKIKVFYSIKEQRFLPDRYVKGVCAKCGYEDANGDQCEKCATLLDAEQLLNPKSSISGGPVELREADHLFFKLNELSEELKKWLNEKNNWKLNVVNLAKGWLKEGLKERCITRDLRHGVKVPLNRFKDKVFYVWFDAPIGYISFTKEARPTKWKKFWENKDAKIFHFLGKDNIPFHTIFWPAMLMANKKFNLPYRVEGMEYLNYEGGKFSKSKNRGVFCGKFPETDINPDIMRAYLTFIIPESGDREFSWLDFQNKLNSEVIAKYGNFINRTLTFAYEKLGGNIEKPSESELTEGDRELIKIMHKKVERIDYYLENVQLKNAFVEIISLSVEGNKYFESNKPWNIIKQDINRTKHILYLCADLCRILAILAYPYLPNTSRKIYEQLNLKNSIGENSWDFIFSESMPRKHTINKPFLLLNKITDEYLDEIKKNVSEIKLLEKLFH